MSRKAEPTEPFCLGDGEVYFFHPDAFRDRYNAAAVMVRDGAVFVLPEGSDEFTNIKFIHRKGGDPASTSKGRS